MKNPMLDEEFLKQLMLYPHRNTYAKITALTFAELPTQEISGNVVSGSINVDGTSSVRRACSLTLTTNNINISDYLWGLNTKFRLEIGLLNPFKDEYPKMKATEINKKMDKLQDKLKVVRLTLSGDKLTDAVKEINDEMVSLQNALERVNDYKYPEIIWFNEGIFLISSFSSSLAINNYTISIQGKDKMCLLNGEVGGMIPASWDFGKIDTYEKDSDGNIIRTVTENYPIKDIILQGVHEFSQEPWQNIIVNDLDDYGVELLAYVGDDPLFLIMSTKGSGGAYTRNVVNMTLNPNMKCIIASNNSVVDIGSTLIKYDDLIDLDLGFDDRGNRKATEVKFEGSDDIYTIAMITRGQTIGYRVCDIIYPSELILNPGEAFTSVLDKLVTMLGNFEYFFDVDGRFIFQKKKTYLDVSWNNLIGEHSRYGETFAQAAKLTSKYSFSFEGDTIISSLQNSPNISNLKNDYVISGEKTTASGATTPIHVRYAVDQKPVFYRTFIEKDDKGNVTGGQMYTTKGINLFYDKRPCVLPNGVTLSDNWWYVDDWAEMYRNYTGTYPTQIIGDICKEAYPMTEDPENIRDRVFNGSFKDCQVFDYFLSNNSIQNHGNNCRHYYSKDRGDAAYSSTIVGRQSALHLVSFIYKPTIPTTVNTTESVDWRELIYQMANDYRKHYHDDDFLLKIIQNNTVYIKNSDGSVVKRCFYPTGYTGYEKYYIDFEFGNTIPYWRELYDPMHAGTTHAGNYYNEDGWNTAITQDPDQLHFWFDFLDSDAELSKFSVHSIGDRPKVKNDNSIKSIYFRETPNVIFNLSDNLNTLEWNKTGYTYLQVSPGLNDLFKLSSQGKSAMDELENCLFQNLYCVDSVTLNTIPIYYLQPNILIYIKDDTTKIAGEYILSRYSIQLGVGSQMSITAEKTAQRIR